MMSRGILNGMTDNVEQLKEFSRMSLRDSTSTGNRRLMDKHDIPILGNFYTKAEVDAMIADALAEARAIDEESMRKHNRDATIISMILGFTCLALFLDGLLRILGIIPPFMGLDVNVIDDLTERIEQDIIPQVQKYKAYIPRI